MERAIVEVEYEGHLIRLQFAAGQPLSLKKPEIPANRLYIDGKIVDETKKPFPKGELSGKIGDIEVRAVYHGIPTKVEIYAGADKIYPVE